MLMALFAPNAKPKASQQRPTAVRRRHTTIPVASESAPNQSTPAEPAAASPAKSEKHPTPTKPRRSTGGGGVLSLLTTPLPPPKSQQRKVRCVTCLDDEVPALKSVKLECGHRMCHPCLKRVFLLSTQDPQLMPPKCCTDKCIPLRHVERLFTDKFKRAWNRKYDEYSTRNRLYCPAKGCSEWIDPKHIRLDRNVGRRYGVCPKCKTKACKKCGLKWHGTRDCENDVDTAAVMDMARQQGWQRCYSCRAMVQLAEGCNHMSCRCGAEFCYLCGVRWKTCDCPWFNVPPDQQAPPPWEDFFRVDVRRYRIHDDIPLPPPPPPPPMFRDRRDMPLDPLRPPDIFRPADIPAPPPPPPPPMPIDGPARMRRYRRERRAQEEQQGRDDQQADDDQRRVQEAEDEALALRLQEQEIDSGLGLGDLNLRDGSPERIRAARRERRRRRQAATLDDDFWQDRLRPIEVGEGAVERP